MNGRERPRGPPPSDARRGGGNRNGASESSMSRAEKFEDEKKRIIQSCYAKKDSDGTLVESYITHVRITEDSAHPSTPAPANSPPENKKARVIIVSVRRSGRVRMHKARENNDGSFSIGKTWMLDDLSAIQSYNAWVPSTPAEQQQKQWASNVGFVITVGKPYYWHARSSKEKDFFIGSLVKIYKKYTGGKVPNLIGFDDKERQLLTGGAASSEAAAPSSPQPQYAGRDPSRDGSREARRGPSEDPVLRAQKSREHVPQPSTGSRPSTGYGKTAPSPFVTQGPPPTPPPSQPPPRAPERLAAELKPPISETKSKEAASTFLITSDSTSRVGAKEDERPPSSRTGEPTSKPQLPALATQPIEFGSLEPKPSTDGLRPTTPGSFSNASRNVEASPVASLGQKSPSQEKEVINGPTKAAAEPPKPEDLFFAPSIDPAVAAAVVASESPQELVKKPSADLPPTSPPMTAEEENEAHRPGLGPMVKKKASKDIVGAFRKAANAYGAFKPRPGGAGERLLAAAKKQQAETVEPDGITGVVPAPSLSRSVNEPPRSPVVETTMEKELPIPETAAANEAPTVEITQPPVETTRLAPIEPPKELAETVYDTVRDVPDDRSRTPSPAPQGRRGRRREDNTIKYCQALGIDPGVLDSRGIDFDDILSDLGWNGRLSDEKKIEDLEADVRREIGRVEATSWLGNLEQQEGKVEQLAKVIDKTIEECEELDGLLTLYSHELNTLNDDVAYIEAQSQGLQVQTANQKLLQNELQNLLKTLSISTSELRPLKEASLSNPGGLKDTENALSTLYKAMLTIDSDIGQNKKRLVDDAGEQGSVAPYADTEIGQMRAIKEKKEEYRSSAQTFLERLKQFMNLAFKMAEQKRADALASVSRDPMKLDSSARGHFRREVWMYNALMLFAREVGITEWHGLVSLYEQQSKPSYQNEFRDNNLAWKKAARKPTGEDQELLFTHQEKEKEGEGITMAARKLTVRRGKTVRAVAGFRLASNDKKAAGKPEPCEAFAGTLREVLNMIAEEQDFVIRFFHLDSLASADFPDLVASSAPEARACPDLSSRQPHDPDRRMAKRVEQIMDEIYSFWPNDMQNMVDWAVIADPLQGIGILVALEAAMTEFDDTNQEFILHSLQKLHSRLMGLFNRFVDEQIRGIEDTKVKVKKRKGVISFMRVFPNFSSAVENMLSHPSGEFCDIRISVNDAYDRINRAMWESLKFIAKETPGQPTGIAAGAGAGDPEDKEVLNYHILLIENMNHYMEEVDVHNLPVLERWVDRAQQDFQEHLKLYLDAVIHRPLGKLLDFIRSVENLQAANGNPADIASRTSHSRMVAKKVLASYDAKEVRRGIELLKKRVEKHFGDADDPGLSRSLVVKVLRACETRYEDAYDRTRRIIDSVYEGQMELEWRKDETQAMFRK